MNKTTAPRRAAIYARVSTSAQSTDNQLSALRELAAARGYEIAVVITDTESGAAESRPGLTQLLQQAERQRFDIALFWSLDRITRRGVPDAIGILQRLRSAGCQYVFAKHPEIDTSGPWGDVVIAIFAALAQIERDMLRARTKAGLVRARSQGKELGRPRRVFRIDQAAELRAQGKPLAAIAEQLGVSRATIFRRLRTSEAATPRPE